MGGMGVFGGKSKGTYEILVRAPVVRVFLTWRAGGPTDRPDRLFPTPTFKGFGDSRGVSKPSVSSLARLRVVRPLLNVSVMLCFGRAICSRIELSGARISRKSALRPSNSDSNLFRWESVSWSIPASSAERLEARVVGGGAFTIFSSTELSEETESDEAARGRFLEERVSRRLVAIEA